jgi:hypothetical protein
MQKENNGVKENLKTSGSVGEKALSQVLGILHLVPKNWASYERYVGPVAQSV